MKILFVVPYAPSLVRVRPYQWIRNLSALGHEVILGTLWSDEKEYEDLQGLKTICPEVLAYPFNRIRSLANCLAALPTPKPLQFVYSWDSSLADRLGQFVLENQDSLDVIHVEHLRGAIFGRALKTHMLRHHVSIPILWDSVDSITHLFRQSARQSKQLTRRLLTSFELSRTQRYESQLAKEFDRVLVTSSIDQEVFHSFVNNSKESFRDHISVIPNGVDLDYFSPTAAGQREEATLVVSGKMSYHANISMTQYLLEEIMPRVWEQKPATKVWIVGKDPDREILKFARIPQVTVTGTVPDIRNYLQKATLSVAPIVYGAGIQNKVLEAMACETPVVTSTLALGALDATPGVDLEVADEPAAYAAKILNLLENPDQRRKLGKAGRAYVEKKHQWLCLAEKLTQIYHEEILEKSGGKP